MPTGDHPRPGKVIAANAPANPTEQEVFDMHEELLVKDAYPSARECGVCHPKHYEDWSVSSHAYAQISPVFNAMQGKVSKLTNGTNGDFCIRCHTPVGMNLNEPTFMSNIDRHPTSREGVTCIVCHRVPQAYGKISGRLAIDRGPVIDPVYGPRGDNSVVEQLMADGKAHADPDAPGRQIHAEAKEFFQITTSAFCGTCHDVTLVNGFRLEEAFSEFKSSPAAKRGETCQDCHMGKEQGLYAGTDEENYPHGPVAVVGGEPTKSRKLTNHLIAGPDYSIVHPALFPLHPRAIREESEIDDPRADGLATIRQWLEFDYEAGWGTNEFEDSIPFDHPFPERWASIDDRYDARDIIEENLALLERATEARRALLKRGYVLGDVEMLEVSEDEVSFKVQVRNGT
ncbi:MAG: multiheme c-type cytochrome, partial [Phycisphaeraceae bacterium]